MTHWIVVVIAFVGMDPADSKIFGPMENEKGCEEQRAVIVEKLLENNLGAFAKCLEVKVEQPKAQHKGEPGTKQKS